MKQTASYKQTDIGENSEEWDIASLKDIVASANTGLDAIKRAPIVQHDTGIKCLRIQDVSQNKRFEDWGFCTVADSNYDRFQLKRDDIMVARTGASVGVNVIIDDDLKSVFNNGLIRIRVNNKVLPQFLFYNFQSRSFVHHIDSISQGTSTQPNIQINSLLRYEIPLPNLNEQQQIISVLSSLDNKIELNRRMNKTLEEIGKALFKRWFVDFEFPNEEGKPYKSSGGEMVESELGMIPKVWEIAFLPQVANIQKGLSYRGQDLVETSDTALVGLKCFERGGGFRKDGIKFYQGEYKNEQVLKPGDLIVAMTDLTQAADVLGKPAIVPFVSSVGTLVASLDLSIIKPNTQWIDQNYLYLLLSRQESQDFLFGYSNGSTVLHLSINGFREFRLVKPHQDVLTKFRGITSSLFNRQMILDRENTQLSAIRESLLPRLMSGKLRVN